MTTYFKPRILDEWREPQLEGTHFISQRLSGSGIAIDQLDMTTVIERLANPKSPNWQFFFPPILDIDEEQDDEEQAHYLSVRIYLITNS